MHPLRRKHSTGAPSSTSESGYSLLVILLVALVATISTTALALQAYNAYTNSVRQGLARRAREAAEAGLATLIESLNRDFPEWLIYNYSGSAPWSIVSRTTSCTPATSNTPSVSGTVSNFSGREGRYLLRSYTFEGTSYYGGKGRFVMDGELRDSSSNRLLSAARVTQDVTVLAKACNALPGTASNSDALWPGLFMGRIGAYDRTQVKLKPSSAGESAKPALVLCQSDPCPTTSGRWNSTFPPAPTIDTTLTLPPTATATGLVATSVSVGPCTIRKLPDDTPATAKRQDSDGTWHVAISSITGTGSSSCPTGTRLQISRTPLRVYLSGSLNLPQYVILDTSLVARAADFMILGTRSRVGSTPLQTLSFTEPLGSSGQPVKAFVYVPAGAVKFQLTVDRPHLLEGAIWAQSYDATASATYANNYVDLSVPADLPSLVFQRLGTGFGVGLRDYVAQGVSHWQSHGRQP